MSVFWIILSIIASYFLLVFVVLRLVVPFMGFSGFKMPQSLPLEIKNKIRELETQNTSAVGYLKAAYDFVANRCMPAGWIPFSMRPWLLGKIFQKFGSGPVM